MAQLTAAEWMAHRYNVHRLLPSVELEQGVQCCCSDISQRLNTEYNSTVMLGKSPRCSGPEIKPPNWGEQGAIGWTLEPTRKCLVGSKVT